MSHGHQRSVPDDWYRHSFDALYPIVYAHRSVEAAAPEAAFAVEQLGLSRGDGVLDLCCGNGRHMVHLLRRTDLVAGLDYSRDLLDLARTNTGGGLLLRADMRALPFDSAFDVVVNFFTSFGYFPTREENLRVVHEVARVLKPGGRFFIDYLNAGFVTNTLVPESTREQGGHQIREHRWIDPERRRVNKNTVVSEDGHVIGQWGESVQLYGATEFVELLAQGGLEVDQMYGDYSGAPLDDTRPRMIAVGRGKRGADGLARREE